MKPKTTLTLFLILVLLSAFYYFYQYKGGQARRAARERAEKLLIFEKDSVKTIVFTKGDESILLKKRDDGTWYIVKPVATKADITQVNSILNVMANAKIERVVADSTANLSAFGLAPPRAKIIFEYASGGKDSILIGDRNATRGYTFAMVNNKPQVVLSSSSLANTAEKSLFDLRDKTVLDFQKSQVRKITFKAKGKRYVVEKNDDGKWQLTYPVETLADGDEIDKILNRLDVERASKFVAEKPENLSPYGLAPPVYTIELILAPNDARKTLFIGKEADKNNYYAKDEARDPVMEIGKYLVDLMPKDLFQLADKHVLHFDRYAIKSFDLSYGDTTITVQKDTADTWLVVEPDTFKAKSWRISSLLGTLERLKAEEIVTTRAGNLARYGLQRPVCTVTLIDSLSNVQDVLYWGKDAKNETAYVTNRERKKVFRVKSYNLNSIKLKVADLKE